MWLGGRKWEMDALIWGPPEAASGTRLEQHGMTLQGRPGRKQRAEPEEGTDWPRIMGGGESRSPAPLQLCPCPHRLQGVQ